jgi:flagellar basal-body rod protein FlgG
MSRRFQFSLRALLVAVLLTGSVCGMLRLLLDDEETFECTNNPLDVFINGDGFFAVIDTTNNSRLYTRAGNLAVNSNGQLVIGSPDSGRIMQPPLSLPTTSGLVFGAEGGVWIWRSGNQVKVGQLQLATFVNTKGLLRVGENLYRETSLSGPPIFGQPGDDGFGVLYQNMLERRLASLVYEKQGPEAEN